MTCCPTCNGEGRIRCPGPFTDSNPIPLRTGRKYIDWCYGIHMGHPCPDCTTPGNAA